MPDVVQASRASPRLAKVVCFMYVCVVVVVMKIQAPSLRTISVGGSHSRSLCPLHPLLQRAELPLSLSLEERLLFRFSTSVVSLRRDCYWAFWMKQDLVE